MALFEALGQLSGAALLTAAPACDILIAPEVAKDIEAFAGWSRGRSEASALDAVVDALAREIWVGAETRGLSQQALEAHASAIAKIIASYPPQGSQLAQAVERSRAGAAGDSFAGDSFARRIAVDIFSRARGAGAVSASNLKDDVTLFMIDRVYAHLLDEPKVLFRLAPVITAYLDARSAKSSDGALSGKGLAAFALPADLAHHLEAAGGTAFLSDLRERYGLSEKAIANVLRLLERQSVNAADLVARIEEVAAWLGDVKAQLLKPTNEDAETRRLKSKAASALADGDFETAAEVLKQVRRDVREARRRIEERLSDEVASLKALMNEEARSTARLAEFALAKLDFLTASELFGEAALALPTADRDGAWKYNLHRVDALVRLGESGANPAVLGEAINAYGHLIRSAAEASNAKGLSQASLGLAQALAITGQREAGTVRLKDAAAAMRKAIALLAREGDGKTWAQAHFRLARVLALTGERDQSAALLRDSVQAFREAIMETKPDRAADIAAAQMGLGNVLLTLEEKEPGTPLLVEAVDAYSAAIAVLSRSADSSLWAEAQMNLGVARLGLGEQQSGTESLEGAVQAFRSALEVSTRQVVPEKWALLQLNLGNALAALGDRIPGSWQHLDEAIGAYHAALEVFKLDSEPMKWAIAKMNLGTALIRMGDHRDKRRNWLAAAGELVPALEVFENQGATAYADVTRRNLRRFQESWENLMAPVSQSATVAVGPSTARLSKTG